MTYGTSLTGTHPLPVTSGGNYWRSVQTGSLQDGGLNRLRKIYFEKVLPVSIVLPLPCVPGVWVPREVALCPHVPVSLMV